LPESNSDNYNSEFVEGYSDQPLQETMGKIEENIIKQALDSAGWNYSKAASMLGVTRQNLHYKLKKYGISKKS
jgi:DNA-binding NtrC family response regulator